MSITEAKGTYSDPMARCYHSHMNCGNKSRPVSMIVSSGIHGKMHGKKTHFKYLFGGHMVAVIGSRWPSAATCTL